MKVPYGWLLELLPDLPPVAETAELLADIGLGVEGVETLPAAPPGVVVAEVLEVSPVKGSEHLLRTVVTDGHEKYSVVTGAPNTRVGMRTALAKPGTELPAVGLHVTKRDFMGVESNGVLCSPRELGLYDYAGGLIAFGKDAPVGAELQGLWPEEVVLELEITPNRADAFSLLGVARDLSAKLGVPYRHPAADVPLADPAVDDGLTVEVRDGAACPRFTLRRVEGVTVGPSPVWLQRRLAAVGLRPRNNVVDVTNYVTFELGQPSHAYDLDGLVEHTIVVRRAQAGETLVALNEEALTFGDDDLLITTPRASGGGEGETEGETMPIGVAGVIGGLHHSVNPATTGVALEVAHFDPVTVRKAAKRLGVSTDASYRFERGVDPNLPPKASARAAGLIAELAGGRVHPGLTEVGGDAPLKTIKFRPSRVAFLAAVDVPLEAQARYLEALGCQVERKGGDDWRVTAPGWRFDLAIEEDLIEEVARLYGYDHIPVTVPAMHFVPPPGDATHRGLRDLLAGMGWQETITYVFTNDELLARAHAPGAAVRLESPPSAERSALRTALHPGLLSAAAANRAAERLALFEVGRVFGEREEERLGFIARGAWGGGDWQGTRPLDFYAFKGALEGLAATLGAEIKLEPHPYPPLHPGVSATVLWAGEPVGWAGRLHPAVAAAFELPETYLAELRLPLKAEKIAFQDFARQPYAERDLSVIAPKSVTYAALERVAREAGGERLETVTPFDVYEGAPVAKGERSVALRLRFRHPGRALRDEEVDGFMRNVIAAFQNEGYTIRDR